MGRGHDQTDGGHRAWSTDISYGREDALESHPPSKAHAKGHTSIQKDTGAERGSATHAPGVAGGRGTHT